MNRAGLTLLELVAFIAVLGILSALTVPKFALCVNNLKASELPRAIKAIQKAEEAFYIESGEYADCPWADANSDNANDNIEASLGILVPGKYFYYAADANGGNFSIESWVYRSFGHISENTKVTMSDQGEFSYSDPSDGDDIRRLKEMCHYLK